MTPTETINRIAQVAGATSALSGAGGSELAGRIISALARNPEYIDPFITGKIGIVDMYEIMRPEAGVLSWHNKNHEVIYPEMIRGSDH